MHATEHACQTRSLPKSRAQAKSGGLSRRNALGVRQTKPSTRQSLHRMNPGEGGRTHVLDVDAAHGVHERDGEPVAGHGAHARGDGAACAPHARKSALCSPAHASTSSHLTLRSHTVGAQQTRPVLSQSPSRKRCTKSFRAGRHPTCFLARPGALLSQLQMQVGSAFSAHRRRS